MGGDLAEMDRLRDWLATLPQTSFIRWRSGGHTDHLHVSFHLQSTVGTIPVGPEGLLAGASGTPPAEEPTRTSSLELNEAYRATLAEVLGRGQ